LSPEFVQAFHDFFMMPLMRPWLLRLKIECAAGLERAMVNFVQMSETLPVGHRKQLGLGQQFLGQPVFANVARLR
jgi:hypothetical protein